MKESHDKLAQRLVLILMKLNNGERFTIEELVEEFNVSKRTIQRDINEKFSFLPIKKVGDYYTLESYALGKLGFEDIKSFATLSGIKSLYPVLSDSFISDILNSKINSAYLIKNQNFEDISKREKDFELLSVAILKNYTITFEYKNKIREINPYKLINNNGIWYLLADENDRLKTYTFSKISKIKEKNKIKFTPKKEFLNQITENELNWFTTDKLIEVTLKIDNIVKDYFFRKKVFPNEKVLEENDKYCIIATKVSYDDEILRVVKYWLPYIKIVKPTNLQEKLNNILKNYLNS